MNKNILSGKVAIITGASQGLGLEIAKKYVSAGANVMLCARSISSLNSVKRDLKKHASPEQKIITMAADVSVESDVQSLIDETLNKFSKCHILVNNAGIYGPKGEIDKVIWDDWVKAIEINLFGSVLMSRKILPYFKRQKYGKIIQLSGGGATNPLPKISAYATSKAAIVRFSETLSEEVKGTGIDVNAIAPGALNTQMLDEILRAGPEKVGNEFYCRALKQKENGGISVEVGAKLAVFLASNESDGITGKLISAVWDDWENWPKHIEELNSSDVYTLRRIVGRDRNIKWGDK